MKLQFLLTVAASIAALTATAQGKYFVEGTTWTEVRRYNPHDDYSDTVRYADVYEYTVGGDSVVNGLRYKVVYGKTTHIDDGGRVDSGVFRLVREDGDSVYVCGKAGYERLLYDFDWQLGKKFYLSSYGTQTLTEVTHETLADGETYDYWRTMYRSIGCTRSILRYVEWTTLENWNEYFVVSFSRGGTTVYESTRTFVPLNTEQQAAIGDVQCRRQADEPAVYDLRGRRTSAQDAARRGVVVVQDGRTVVVAR